MARKLLFILVVTTMFISACSSPAVTAIPTDNAIAPTEAVKAVSTETLAAVETAANTPQATETDEDTSPTTEGMMPGCTITTRMEPEPTEESLFGAVTESDWVIGPEDATVTLIEYSDFQ